MTWRQRTNYLTTPLAEKTESFASLTRFAAKKIFQRKLEPRHHPDADWRLWLPIPRTLSLRMIGPIHSLMSAIPSGPDSAAEGTFPSDGVESCPIGQKPARGVAMLRTNRDNGARGERELMEHLHRQEKGPDSGWRGTSTRPVADVVKPGIAAEYPGVRQCDGLPDQFMFTSPHAALNALKATVGDPSLRLTSARPSDSGPCPGTGMHYGVKPGDTYVASISCCPCCRHTPAGPVVLTRCNA